MRDAIESFPATAAHIADGAPNEEIRRSRALPGEWIMKIKRRIVGDGFETTEPYRYFSPRYGRAITIPKLFYSDGATGAIDIESDAWIIHDHICRYGVWDDGAPINNWQASTVLSDILWSEGRWCRAIYWWFATWLFGGGAARENGMTPQ